MDTTAIQHLKMHDGVSSHLGPSGVLVLHTSICSPEGGLSPLQLQGQLFTYALQIKTKFDLGKAEATATDQQITL